MIKFFKKQDKLYFLFIFLISPIAGLWLSFKDYTNPYSKNIIWIFCVFYGYTLVISNPEMDANRLKDFFTEYAQYQDFSFSRFLTNLYAEDSWNTDVLSEFLRWSVSRITDDYHIYFATLGLVFGYFYSRNIWYLIEISQNRINRNSLIFIIIFGIVVAFWEINIFRFFTAAHIFFFGSIRYLIEGKKKFILIAFLSIFVHFSFLLPSIVLFLFFVLGNRPKIYFGFFLVSFAVSEIDIEFLRTIEIPFLPTVFEKKLSGYTSDTYVKVVEGIKSLDKNWYVIASEIAIKLVVGITLSLAIKNNLDKIKEFNLLSIYCFSLIMVGVSNFISNVPALDRFSQASYLFVFAFLFLLFQNLPNIKWFNKLKKFIFIGLFLFSIVELRIGADTIGFRAISSPLIAFFLEEDVALIEVLK